jgi:hypothetical protein
MTEETETATHRTHSCARLFRHTTEKLAKLTEDVLGTHTGGVLETSCSFSIITKSVPIVLLPFVFITQKLVGCVDLRKLGLVSARVRMMLLSQSIVGLFDLRKGGVA